MAATEDRHNTILHEPAEDHLDAEVSDKKAADEHVEHGNTVDFEFIETKYAGMYPNCYTMALADSSQRLDQVEDFQGLLESLAILLFSTVVGYDRWGMCCSSPSSSTY